MSFPPLLCCPGLEFPLHGHPGGSLIPGQLPLQVLLHQLLHTEHHLPLHHVPVSHEQCWRSPPGQWCPPPLPSCVSWWSLASDTRKAAGQCCCDLLPAQHCAQPAQHCLKEGYTGTRGATRLSISCLLCPQTRAGLPSLVSGQRGRRGRQTEMTETEKTRDDRVS